MSPQMLCFRRVLCPRNVALLVVFLHMEPAFARGVDDWSNRIALNGAIKVDATSGSNFAGGSSSDIRLKSVEFGMDADVADNVTGHLLVLHEDDGTEPWEVDEGTVNFDWNPLYFTAGRMYVPFGTYQTHLVSDPLTLELGETREAALQLGIDWEGLYGSFYVYNGDINTAESAASNDDNIDQFGFSLGFDGEIFGLDIDTGFDFISNLADSNTLQTVVTPQPSPTVEEYVSGWAVHCNVTWEPVSLLFEYVAAGEFLQGELAFNGAGATPSALQIEGVLGLSVFDTNVEFAVGYQSSAEAVAVGLAESKLLVGVNVELDEKVNIGAEFAHSADYSVDNGGSGEAASVISGQIAIGF